MRTKIVPVVGLAAAVVALSVPARESLACGNGVELEIERTTMLVAQAEDSSNRGFHVDALQYLGFLFPNGRPRDDYLGDRAKLIVARAIARTDGRFGLRGIEVEKEDGAASNLSLAARFVQDKLSKKPDDPALRTDYAEVLSHIPTKQAEAKRILVELEKKDLVASAFGYAALARLRVTPRKDLPSWLEAPLAALDRAPREIDLARCERMAAYDGVCAREGAKPGTRTATDVKVVSPKARPKPAPPVRMLSD